LLSKTIFLSNLSKQPALCCDKIGKRGKTMTTLTIEISETLDEQVSVVAKRSKLSKEKLAARALQDFINRQMKNGLSKQTVAEVAGHLFGAIDVDAPDDISTNKKYLEGFGE
jgi:predicted transcriptional regulator